jgi:hypothetical protein
MNKFYHIRFILCVCVFYVTSHIYAQTLIPEGHMENWSLSGTGSFEEPTGGWWTSLNSLKSLGGPVTLTKTTDAYSGSYAAKMETKQWGTFLLPGLLVSGDFTTASPFIIQGKPYTELPIKFKGYYKYTSVSNDSAAIFAMITRYNTLTGKRDTIADASLAVLATVTTYTPFDIDFNYHNPYVSPDSIDIVFSSSAAGGSFQGQVGSTLFVDEISLEYPSGITENIFSEISVDLYPNPSDESIRIFSQENDLKECTGIIYALNGDKICTISNLSNNYLLNTKLFPGGKYFLNIYSEKELIATKKFTVVH